MLGPLDVDGEMVAALRTYLESDDQGNTSATKTGNYVFGPYIRSVPPLPVEGLFRLPTAPGLGLAFVQELVRSPGGSGVISEVLVVQGLLDRDEPELAAARRRGTQHRQLDGGGVGMGVRQTSPLRFWSGTHRMRSTSESRRARSMAT